MQNKKMILVAMFGLCAVFAGARADDAVFIEETIDTADVSPEEMMENLSADAIENYDVQGSLFQQITDLEQEKVLMQLEKERAQLDLELDRLAAEKIKLHMEIDTLSSRAEQQQMQVETEIVKLENEANRLVKEQAELMAQEEEVEEEVQEIKRAKKKEPAKETDISFADKYRLINVIGAGNQLQATIEDLNNGQTKRISVGKKLDGYTVKSISLDEGIVFTKGEDEQSLGVDE